MKQKPLFWEMVKSKRREIPKKKRKVKQPKNVAMVYPAATEREYKKKIKELLKPIVELAEFEILNNISRWIEEYKITTKRDSYPDEIPQILQKLNAELKRIFEEGGDQVRTMITSTGYSVSDKNKAQVKKFMKSAVGVELILTEPWEIEVVKAWAQANFQLISTLPNDYIRKINSLVSEGVQYGESAASISKKMKSIGEEILNARPELIARDQVAKLQSNINERRQLDAGIDMYIWVTAGDERVRGKPGGKYPKARPRHDIMEGLVCRWDDPTVYSEDGGETWKSRTSEMPMVHPGIEINCRCQAIPFFPEFLDQIDKELEEENAE